MCPNDTMYQLGLPQPSYIFAALLYCLVWLTLGFSLMHRLPTAFDSTLTNLSRMSITFYLLFSSSAQIWFLLDTSNLYSLSINFILLLMGTVWQWLLSNTILTLPYTNPTDVMTLEGLLHLSQLPNIKVSWSLNWVKLWESRDDKHCSQAIASKNISWNYLYTDVWGLVWLLS